MSFFARACYTQTLKGDSWFWKTCDENDTLILLMEEILHQLMGSLAHYLQGLYIPGGAGFLPSSSMSLHSTAIPPAPCQQCCPGLMDRIGAVSSSPVVALLRTIPVSRRRTDTL